MLLAFIFESVGAGEWLVLLAVLLVVMGPKNIPSTMRKVGNYYSKFRRAADSFKRQLMEMDYELERTVNSAVEDVKSEVEEIKAEAEDITPEPDYFGDSGFTDPEEEYVAAETGTASAEPQNTERASSVGADHRAARSDEPATPQPEVTVSAAPTPPIEPKSAWEEANGDQSNKES